GRAAGGGVRGGRRRARSRYDPRRHPREAIRRQRHVLDRMLAAGFISAEEHAAALDEPIEFAAPKTPTYDVAPWYVDHVRSLLEAEYGPEFASLGLQAHTALDLRLQEAADVTLGAGLRTIERRLGVRNAVRHLRPDGVEAYLDRQRASRPREGPQHAVVTGMRPHEILIRTPWEAGSVAREDGRAPGTYRSGD